MQRLRTLSNHPTPFQVSTCGRWRLSGSRRRGTTTATMWPPSCRAVSPWSAATARMTPQSWMTTSGPIDRHPSPPSLPPLCFSSALNNVCVFPFRLQVQTEQRSVCFCVLASQSVSQLESVCTRISTYLWSISNHIPSPIYCHLCKNIPIRW